MTRSRVRAGKRDVVEHGQVLDELAQPDAAGVRAHGQIVLGGQQQDGEVLVDPADTRGVDLQDVERRRPGCSCLNTTRFCACSPVATFTGATDLRIAAVAEDVVGAGRLLDPVRVESAPDRGSRRWPASTSQRWLASIAMLHVGADRFARRASCAATSSARSAPTFSLICVEAVAQWPAWPAGSASRRSSRASPARWCRPGSRRVEQSCAARSAAPCLPRLSRSTASS